MPTTRSDQTKKGNRVFWLWILFTLLTGCRSDRFVYHPDPVAGICLSFDDYAVDAWYELRLLFQHYGVKATFFVTRFDSLTPTQVEKLRVLQQEGHEIGYHGGVHVISEHYIKEHSLADYMAYEIVPGLRSLERAGFTPVSFAYPYSAKYDGTDRELLKYFRVIRSSVPLRADEDITQLDDIYYTFTGKRLVDAVSIDTQAGINPVRLQAAFDRVRERHETILLHTHEPGREISVAELESLFQLVQQNKLRYLRTIDLVQ
jgi:peptidoglycan-N-acetylglucosamine deacetylase